METDDRTETPTASQKRDLLQENEGFYPETATTSQKVDASVIPNPPQNLADLKKLTETNANFSGAEMSMSLQSGKVTVIKPSRSRSKSKRNFSKSNRKPEASVNPHERIKNDLATNTPKRGRESGGTPPSASQPNKKAHGQTANETGNKNPISAKAVKNRLKAKRKREAQKQKAGSTTTEESVPPLTSGSKSIGADKSVVVAQQTAVPL